MSSEKESSTVEFKSYYIKIFLFFYLIEGMHQALIPVILPIYLLDIFGGQYDIAWYAIIVSAGSLPWALKFIVGIINDKWGSEKYGRRFPFIITFGIWGAIIWIIMAFTVPADDSVYMYFFTFTIINNIGFAVADTALDGMILDVTPKERLGKVQGFTWSTLLFGSGVAGVLFFFIYSALGTATLPLIFVIMGILTIIACITTFWVKEPPVEKDVDVWKDLKFLVTKKQNLVMFSYSFIDRISEVIIFQIYSYLILLSMGLISVEDTILKLMTGQSIDLLLWYAVFIGANGIGIILGSLITGKIIDNGRRKAIYFAYIIYLPISLLCNFFLGIVFGIIGQIILGIAFGAISVSGQTIRGDITRKKFPGLKSTYFAILISFSNLGLAFAGFFSANLISWFATITSDFYFMHFLITVVCAILIVISFLIFLLIDQKDYEFEVESLLDKTDKK